jgi:hypothetical protein
MTYSILQHHKIKKGGGHPRKTRTNWRCNRFLSLWKERMRNVFVLSTVLNCNQKTADLNLTLQLATVTGLHWLPQSFQANGGQNLRRVLAVSHSFHSTQAKHYRVYKQMLNQASVSNISRITQTVVLQIKNPNVTVKHIQLAAHIF